MAACLRRVCIRPDAGLDKEMIGDGGRVEIGAQRVAGHASRARVDKERRNARLVRSAAHKERQQRMSDAACGRSADGGKVCSLSKEHREW